MGQASTDKERKGFYTAVIADDHEIVRAGLRAALETPGTVTAGTIEGPPIAVVAALDLGANAR